MAAAGSTDRTPLSITALVAAARSLLTRGGLENVTIRDVAQQLKVTSPALYKHVSGRAEIVDLLAAACLDELTERITSARDGAGDDDHRGRLLAASRAWSGWAHACPAEHALIFATPAVPFDRPADGRSHQAGIRLGAAFLAVLVPAARAGKLRTESDVPAPVVVQLRAWAKARGLDLSDGQLWTAVRGFQDVMGMIMTESAGQLGFALADTSAYMDRRLCSLTDDLLDA